MLHVRASKILEFSVSKPKEMVESGANDQQEHAIRNKSYGFDHKDHALPCKLNNTLGSHPCNKEDEEREKANINQGHCRKPEQVADQGVED